MFVSIIRFNGSRSIQKKYLRSSSDVHRVRRHPTLCEDLISSGIRKVALLVGRSSYISVCTIVLCHFGWYVLQSGNEANEEVFKKREADYATYFSSLFRTSAP